MNVLLMCLSDPSKDPRPRRNIEVCKKLNYNVDLVSYYPKDTTLKYDNLYLLKIKSTKFQDRFFRYFNLFLIFSLQKIFSNNKILDYLNNKRFLLDILIGKVNKNYDFIIVEDLCLLPIAFKIKGNAKLIFDVREYYPKQLESSFFFRFLEQKERYRLCKYYLPLCDYLFTVSNGLAIEYKREFNVDMQILMSVPNRKLNSISKNEKIKIVHHGIANWNRKLENMIHIFNMLDERFTFDFYLTGNKNYINRLKYLANSNQRISFKDPIDLNEITVAINKYDIGFFYVEPTTFNLRHCLPNKFFEFIQANLMIAIGPSPDMMRLVNKYNCGIVSNDFNLQSMAKELNQLTKALINEFKINSSIAAKELCFEVESNKLVEILKPNTL